MNLFVRDLMTPGVISVDPRMPLTELERRFVADGVSGYPVLENGKLVGLVARGDIVRQLCVEQTLAESTSDYYREVGGFQHDAGSTLQQIADEVGQRLETMRVKDVMVKHLHTIAPGAPLAQAAELLTSHHIHRVPVVDQGKLVGILSTFDFVSLYLKQGKDREP